MTALPLEKVMTINWESTLCGLMHCIMKNNTLVSAVVIGSRLTDCVVLREGERVLKGFVQWWFNYDVKMVKVATHADS